MQNARVVKVGEEHDVYIGRPSMWGNPFVLGQQGTREEVIAKFEQWMRKSADPEARKIRAAIHTLHGKRLGCYCAPLACHGDVLAKWAEVKFNERVGGSS